MKFSVLLASVILLLSASSSSGHLQARKNGRVCVVAFDDANRNGVRDKGETALGHRSFIVTRFPDGGTVGAVISSAAGVACTSSLGAGQYVVSETLPAGWTPTRPATGVTKVSVADAAPDDLVTFGNSFSAKLAPICIAKYSDKNSNGRQDPGEPGLAGRIFRVKDAATGKVVRTLKSKRRATCTQVLAGRYVISEARDPSTVPILPTTGREMVTAAAGVKQVITFGDHLFRLDHFECYSISPGKFGPRAVGLTDQFGSRRATLTSRQQLCTPVSKNGQALLRPRGHLVCYGVSSEKPAGKTVVTSDQFGENRLRVGAPGRLCVPSGKSAKAPVAPPAGLEHYLCYDVRPLAEPKGSALPVPAPPPAVVRLTDQFWTTKAVVLAPSQLCTPVQKRIGPAQPKIANPDDHLLCYTIRTRGFAHRAVVVRNQFETVFVRPTAPQSLCLPAVKEVEDPIPTQWSACDQSDTEAPPGSVPMDGTDPITSDNGPIDTLYPGQDTTGDTWYANEPCDWSIGGEVPPEAQIDPYSNNYLNAVSPGASTSQVVNNLGQIEANQVLSFAQSQPLIPP